MRHLFPYIQNGSQILAIFWLLNKKKIERIGKLKSDKYRNLNQMQRNYY